MSISESTFVSRMSPDSRIYIRVASQISLEVRGVDIFREVRRRILAWAREKIGPGLPSGAWEGKAFETEAIGSQRAGAVALENAAYWAFRLDDSRSDPGRTWTTEVGIHEFDPTGIRFGARLLCSEQGMPSASPRSIQNFVRGIAFTQECYLDGRRIGPEPWFIESREDIRALIDFLVSDRRKHPVVVFSLPEGVSDPEQTAIPVSRFIRRTVGFVHSVIITGDAAYNLTDEVGRDFTVYRQAIRTYNPGFDPDAAKPTDHPVATAPRIAAWAGDGEDSFESFLVNQVLRLSRPREQLEKELPPFQQVKRLAAEATRQAAKQAGLSEAEMLALAEEEIHAAKQEARESTELLAVAEEEREEALEQVRDITASYMAIQRRVEGLESQLRLSSMLVKPLPETLKDLEKWADENLSGSIYICPRAVRAARSSDFEDVEFVYKALLVLRDFYVPMKRLGGTENVNEFEEQIAALGLDNTKCFATAGTAKRFDKEYFVKYRGKERELDWHLKAGNSREGRYGFRLYYFWDNEAQLVVVGHLPSHLQTDAT